MLEVKQIKVLGLEQFAVYDYSAGPNNPVLVRTFWSSEYAQGYINRVNYVNRLRERAE